MECWKKNGNILKNTYDNKNVLREDNVEPSFDRDEILKNAESQEEGYFLVKKHS